MSEETTDKLVISIKHGENVYTLDATDVDGAERRDFRQAVGYSLRAALLMTQTGRIDELEFLAGCLWLLRRREDKKLSFDDVLKSVTEANTSIEEDEADPPTDSGASS